MPKGSSVVEIFLWAIIEASQVKAQLPTRIDKSSFLTKIDQLAVNLHWKL